MHTESTIDIVPKCVIVVIFRGCGPKPWNGHSGAQIARSGQEAQKYSKVAPGDNFSLQFRQGPGTQILGTKLAEAARRPRTVPKSPQQTTLRYSLGRGHGTQILDFSAPAEILTITTMIMCILVPKLAGVAWEPKNAPRWMKESTFRNRS